MLLIVQSLETMSVSSPYFSDCWWHKAELIWETDHQSSLLILQGTVLEISICVTLEIQTSLVEKKVVEVQLSFCPCYTLDKVILVRFLCLFSLQCQNVRDMT